MKSFDSPSLKKHTSVIEDGNQFAGAPISSSPPSTVTSSPGMRPKSGSTGSLGLVYSLNPGADPLIVHSGAILSIFHLLPALEDLSNAKVRCWVFNRPSQSTGKKEAYS